MDVSKRVLLAAQDWELMAGINSCAILAEAKPGQTSNVKAKAHAGFLYTAFSSTHGGLGESVIDAWQLIPEKLYAGKVYLDRAWSSDMHPERQRGDYTGYLVKVKGKPMVCAKKVIFVRALPTVQPITMEEAMDHERVANKYGWRSIHYGDKAKVTWRMLAGHPVVIYELDDDDSKATLLWRFEGRICDYYLTMDQSLTDFDAWSVEAETQMAAQSVHRAQPQQACLF
jgi:hypothetical protein